MLPTLLAALVVAQLQTAPPRDTSERAPVPPAAAIIPLFVSPDTSSADTTRRRRVVVEYSDWYARRLTVHRWASYTMLPLFAAQYVAGQQLFTKGRDAPLWARRSHGPMATGAAVLFSVNTLTGLWNLWDSRQDPAGRGPRMAHSLLMIASDAGFTAAGLLATPAQNSGNLRQLHKTIALSSMGVAVVGYTIMLPPFRRD